MFVCASSQRSTWHQWVSAVGVLRLVILALMALSVCAPLAARQIGNATLGPQPPDPVGDKVALHVASHWGGPVWAAVVEDERAYIGNGRMLRILDLSVESNPQEIGSLEFLGAVRDLKLRDGYAFVTTEARSQHFNVVDLSDPSSPLLVASFEGGGSVLVTAGHSVDIYDHFAYVFSPFSFQPIDIFDIQDPAQVVYLKSMGPPSPSHLYALLTIHSGHLYLATGNYSAPMLLAYDLRVDPVDPLLVGILDAADLGANGVPIVNGMVAAGDYLYLAIWDFVGSILEPRQFALATISIADPWQPTLVDIETGFGGFDRLTDRARLAVANGRLYVGEHYLPVFDRPNPYDPAYWSVTRGLHVFDIGTDPSAPARIGTYKEHGEVVGALAATGDRVYVSDTAEGLVVLDVGDPAWPVKLGEFHSPSTLRKLVADGDHLYVSDHDGGFTVLDVADPQSPTVVGSYLAKRYLDYGIENVGLAKNGDVVYLATGHSGLLTVNVSDPARPVTLGALRIGSMSKYSGDDWSRFTGLSVRDDVAYLSYSRLDSNTLGFNLLTLDVSDPVVPYPLGMVLLQSDPPLADRIELSGSWLSQAPVGGIFSLKNPVQPQLIFPGYGQSLAVVDLAMTEATRLLAVWGGDPSPGGSSSANDGLHIQSLANPSAPSTLRWIKTGDPVPGCGTMPHGAIHIDMSAGGQRAYLRSSDSVLVFDLSDPANPQCQARLDGLPQGNDPYLRSWTAEVLGGASPQRTGFLVAEPNLYISTATLGLSIVEVDGLKP